MNKNAILSEDSSSAGDSSDLAARIARRTLSPRSDSYTDEVRRLLDAALRLMRERGTSSRPRVSDIVAAAGVSNDVFYRHFPTKDALVAAILDDGTERLSGYLAHQMAKESEPQDAVRRFVEGVLSQADKEIATTTLAVLWNGSGLGDGTGAGRHFASTPVAALLVEPFTSLGSAAPELDASLAAHAVLGKLSDYLWQRKQPTAADRDRIVAACLRIGSATPPRSSP